MNWFGPALLGLGASFVLAEAFRSSSSSTTPVNRFGPLLRTGDPDYDALDGVIGGALGRLEAQSGVPLDADFARLVKTIAWHESGSFRYATRYHPGQHEDAGLMGLRVRYFLGPPLNREGYTADQVVSDPNVNAFLGSRLLASYYYDTDAPADPLQRMQLAASKYAAGPGFGVIAYGRARAGDVRQWWPA